MYSCFSWFAPVVAAMQTSREGFAAKVRNWAATDGVVTIEAPNQPPVEVRLDRTDSKGREVGYKNGLKLNAELATAEAWSVEQIDARTTTLVATVRGSPVRARSRQPAPLARASTPREDAERSTPARTRRRR